MRALVIGGDGFVGRHLIGELASTGCDVYATSIEIDAFGIELPRDHVFLLHLENVGQIRSVFKNCEPQWIINLAGQSSVGLSWSDPAKTVELNVIGSINLIESMRTLGLDARMLLIGSSEEYGAVLPSEVPIAESHPLKPANPYAISKVIQEEFGRLYFQAYRLKILMARSFNHIGAGQNLGFVVPDFCKQIVRIERESSETAIRVGNIDAMRDFTDVRDVVRAYEMILRLGQTGHVYNVGSGKATRVGSLLEALISFSSKKIEIRIDEEKYRPLDVPIISANIERIRSDTGWSPMIPLEQSLKDALQYWRNR
ncbi:MAG: GDP-mannose 4,6-dehydratase [Spirochaetia bacterium]|jgi:GDP-4-dehydro-6-deoxy-D-mannose reductase